MTKFCKDCVYASSRDRYAKCCYALYKKTSEYFLVDGKRELETKDADYCSTQRRFGTYKSEDACGPEGKHFVHVYDNKHFEISASKKHWTRGRRFRWRIAMLLRQFQKNKL